MLEIKSIHPHVTKYFHLDLARINERIKSQKKKTHRKSSAIIRTFSIGPLVLRNVEATSIPTDSKLRTKLNSS